MYFWLIPKARLFSWVTQHPESLKKISTNFSKGRLYLEKVLARAQLKKVKNHLTQLQKKR